LKEEFASRVKVVDDVGIRRGEDGWKRRTFDGVPEGVGFQFELTGPLMGLNYWISLHRG
jgi:hypothetical protein